MNDFTRRAFLEYLGKEFSFFQKGGLAIKYLMKGRQSLCGYHTYYLKDGEVYGKIGAIEEKISF